MHGRSLIFSLLAWTLLAAGCPQQGGRTTARPLPGKAVEMVLESVAGGTVRVSQFRGKPLVLLFFTTWCVVCQVQVARLQPVRAALGNDRVGVLGVALDLQRRLVSPFVEAAGFNFPVAYGAPGMVQKSPLGPVRAVPRIVVLDAKGRPVADFHRPVDSHTLMKALKPLVNR